MTSKQFTTTALILAAVLAAGCATPQTVVVTATPAPVRRQLSDYADLIDPAIAQALAESTAMAGARMLTQQAADRQATQAAADRAQAEAEQARVYATQAALAAAATATQGAMALEQQRLAVTATAEAIVFQYSVSTAEAVRVETERLAAEARAYQAELDRRGAAFWALIRDLFVVGFLVFVAVLSYIVLRWASALTAIHARMKLIDARSGLLLNPRNGEFEPLPAPPPDRLPEPVPELRPIIRRAPKPPPDTERAARLAWRVAAWRFLRLGEAMGTYSRRAMMEAGLTDPEWRDLTDFLAGMGALVKDGDTPNAPYTLPLGEDGQQLSARDVMGRSVWLTSYRVPSPTAPDVPGVGADRTQPTPTHDSQAEPTHERAYASKLATVFDLEGEPMD